MKILRGILTLRLVFSIFTSASSSLFLLVSWLSAVVGDPSVMGGEGDFSSTLSTKRIPLANQVLLADWAELVRGTVAKDE